MNTRKNMFYWQADRPFSAKQIKEIFLDRKVNYNPAEIVTAIEFGLKDSQIETNPKVTLGKTIDFGSVNIVCPFDTESGFKGIVRVFPPQVDNGYFYVEREAIRAAKNVGVPTTEVVYISTDKLTFPFGFMIMTRVPGEVMQTAIERDPKLYKTYLNQIGQDLALLHAVHPEGFGFFDNDQARSGKLVGQYTTNQEHYLSALDADESFYENNKGWFDEDLVSAAFTILKRDASMSICSSPSLIHNDIADWNTIVFDDKVTGILDWDECFGGDPIFDFAGAKLFYPDERFGYLVDGYKQVGPLPDDFNEKIDLYILRYLISKNKISINKLLFMEKESTRNRFNSAKIILAEVVKKMS